MPGLLGDVQPQQGGGILGGLSNFLLNMNPTTPQAQAIYGQHFLNAQIDAMRRANIPEDKILAIISDPNGAAAQTQYGVKQLQGPEYGTETYKPAGALVTGGGVQPYPGQQFPNAPQPPQQMTAPQSARIPAGTPPQAVPGQGATAGAPPPELQQAAPVMDYLRQQKATQVERETAAKGAGEAASDIGPQISQIDRSINLADELAHHPGKTFATGYFANFPQIFAPQGTQAFAFKKGVDQLKDQLTLDILPTLGRSGRMSPALLELLQKSSAGQELALGSPDFDKNLQNTRDALVQVRSALQQSAHVPVTEAPKQEGGVPTYKNQAQLRADIKAGKIKIGQPFKTDDGRTLIAQ